MLQIFFLMWVQPQIMSRHNQRRNRSGTQSARRRVQRSKPPGVDPDWWARLHRKSAQNKVAFVAPRDAHGRVMVVKNRRTGEWMLPGGYADGVEIPNQTGRRETREETGLNLRRSQLKRRLSRNGVTFYDTPKVVSRSQSQRRRTFHRRKDKRETSDYGFVVPEKNRLLQVVNYDGSPKKTESMFFRDGTGRLIQSLA